MSKPRATLELEEGHVHINCLINGEWYSDKIELPKLGNQQSEVQFADVIANLIKNTMLAAGYRKTVNGIPLIK